MTRPFWLFPLALLLAACPGPISGPDGGDDNTLIVGPQGGLFIRNGYGLDVPAGAFTEEQRIFVTIVDTGIPDVPMRKRISLGYRLSPASLVPKVPLTLFIPWVNDRLVPGVDPGTYDMRRQSGTQAYQELAGAKTNQMPVPNVEAKTDKLGLFWLTSPTAANVARLEIMPDEVNLNVGDTQQFTARVVAPTGETIDVPVTWSVVPPRVASIDASGLLTAKDPGIATVTVKSGMQSNTAKVYVRGNTVGPSSFAHENPFPTGNDLLGGAMAGPLGTVYAGGNGTILVEAANGQWTRVFSSSGASLKAVGGTSLNNAVAIGTAGSSAVLVELKGGTTAPAVQVFPQTRISDLSHLWFDGTHGMGVGVGNEVVIYRSGAWTTEYHPSFEALLSVIGDGAGGFTVVGDLGSIYRWDPTRKVWDSLFDTRLAVKLDAAQLVDVNGGAWAVGGGRLWHFVGTGWVAESLPLSPPLIRATAIGLFDNRIFVAGEQRISSPFPPGKGVVLIRSETTDVDGGVGAPSWASFSLRGQQIPRSLFGGGATSPVGRVVGDLGAVWSWDSTGQTFVEKSKGFQGNVADLAVTDNDVYAAVNECADVRCLSRMGIVMHRGISGFEPLGSLPTGEQVHSIVARSNSEIVVGTDSGALIWNGTSWMALIGGLPGPINDLTWCGNTLWGVGDSGGLYKGDITRMQSDGTPTGSDLKAIHCPTPTELWIAGDAYLASGDGNSWTARESDSISQGPWQAVWSPGSGEGFAFGDALFGVYWNTAELQLQQSTGPIGVDVATSMWGSSIDNLYMTGLSKLPAVFGFMLRFDGINWTLVDSGAQRKGTSLTGKSATEIWLGTEGGGVLRAVPPQ